MNVLVALRQMMAKLCCMCMLPVDTCTYARHFTLTAPAPAVQTRTLTRMQVNRQAANGGDVTSDVLRLLKEADGVDVNDGNGPLHVMLHLEPQVRLRRLLYVEML